MESISNAVPPYFAVYASMNALFPFAVASGNQSPQLKIPFTLSFPTFEGNSVGEFAPFDR